MEKERNKTVGIFLSRVSAHTVKTVHRLRSQEEKYETVKMELTLQVYTPCEYEVIINTGGLDRNATRNK